VTPLIDRQHPHDLFMELAGVYSVPVAAQSSAFLYLGYPGEAAPAPPTFMHRFSEWRIPKPRSGTTGSTRRISLTASSRRASSTELENRRLAVQRPRAG